MQTLLHYFNTGGAFMWPIFGFLVLTLALIAERYIALYRKYKAVPADFRQRVLTHIVRGDFRGAEEYCKSQGEAILPRIVATGCHLRAAGAGEEELQARMDEKLSSELAGLDKRTGFLAMFGNVSTLLGLLGTVSGMIQSFAAVASANPADRAILLSQGISQALNTTAFGLIVAIPALVGYSFFQNRTDQLMGGIAEETSKIYHDLLFLTEGQRASTSIATAKRREVVVDPGLAPQPAGV